MYSMKKYLLLFLCLTLGVAYAQDTLRVRVMTYNLRFGELASLEELAHHIKSFKPSATFSISSCGRSLVLWI